MLVMHFRSSSHFGHDNEARNGHAGLYKANNKGKIALTAAVRSSAVIIEPISSEIVLFYLRLKILSN